MSLHKIFVKEEWNAPKVHDIFNVCGMEELMEFNLNASGSGKGDGIVIARR